MNKLIILHEEGEDGNCVNHTVYSLIFIVLYEPCNVQVSKLIILHEDGEDGKSEHVIHTVYSFNPLLYSMNSVMYR